MAVLIWNIDPVWFRLGPLAIPYYGVFLGLTIAISFYLVQRHLRRRGYPEDLTQAFIQYLLAGFLIGTRLGHCFFYHPLHYLQHPLEILQVWRGGISSHGAAVGLMSATILFHRRHRQQVAFLDMTDAAALAGGVGSVLVRLGNFFNSEIVGRVTDKPWAVIFVRYDRLPRHPSQLYEAFGGLVILIVMLTFAERRETRPGLVSGILLTFYFIFRFVVEFFKEPIGPIGFLTTGQLLSLPCMVVGIVWLLVVLRSNSAPVAGTRAAPEPSP